MTQQVPIPTTPVQDPNWVELQKLLLQNINPTTLQKIWNGAKSVYDRLHIPLLAIIAALLASSKQTGQPTTTPDNPQPKQVVKVDQPSQPPKENPQQSQPKQVLVVTNADLAKSIDGVGKRMDGLEDKYQKLIDDTITKLDNLQNSLSNMSTKIDSLQNSTITKLEELKNTISKLPQESSVKEPEKIIPTTSVQSTQDPSVRSELDSLHQKTDSTDKKLDDVKRGLEGLQKTLETYIRSNSK